MKKPFLAIYEDSIYVSVDSTFGRTITATVEDTDFDVILISDYGATTNTLEDTNFDNSVF